MIGFKVSIEEIRAHAEHVAELQDRLGAVKAASAGIAQNDQAYGALCCWISGVLERRHTRQDELLAQGEGNLTQAVAGLRRTADSYESNEASATDLVQGAGNLPGGADQ
jgi:hypothetical protein